MEFNTPSTVASIDLYPIETSTGSSPRMAIGTMPVRPALLLRITDSDGCFGWGEVWANFPPRAHNHKLQVIEDVVAPNLVGLSFVCPEEIQSQLRKSLEIYFLHVGQSEVFEHILAGIDIALWDLALRKHNWSAIDYFNLGSNTAPCYASSINAEDIDTVIPEALSLGQTYFKIKVGFQADNGCDLVQRAAVLARGCGRVMIDSNQSWSLAQAKEALQSLETYEPFFAEEPIPANAPLADWESLANTTNIALAGGENIYGVDRFLSMADAGLTVIQPDVAKWGGVSGALELAEKIPDGVKLWPHFMGTAVGQMASLAITAAIGNSAVCEMDVNTNPLRTDLCGNVMQISEGAVALYTDTGLVAPPAEILEELTVT